VTLEPAEYLRLDSGHLSLNSRDYDKVVNVREDNTVGGVNNHTLVSLDGLIACCGKGARKLLVP
jgi:hypothetical protein